MENGVIYTEGERKVAFKYSDIVCLEIRENDIWIYLAGINRPILLVFEDSELGDSTFNDLIKKTGII